MKARFVAPALAALTAAAVLAVPAAAQQFQVNVTVTDTTCQLALKAVNAPNTAILFHVINDGKAAHGLMIWGVKSHMIAGSQSVNVGVNFHNPGVYHYACTTGSYLHPTTFGKGVFTIRK